MEEWIPDSTSIYLCIQNMKTHKATIMFFRQAKKKRKIENFKHSLQILEKKVSKKSYNCSKYYIFNMDKTPILICSEH